MTTNPCLHCVAWRGTVRDAANERPAECMRTRQSVYADDTCARFKAAISNPEPIAPIVGRVMAELMTRARKRA